MKTKSSDLAEIKAVSAQDINDFIAEYKEKAGFPVDKVIQLRDDELLQVACILGRPEIVKYLLEKRDENESFVIADRGIEKGFVQLLNIGTGWRGSKYFPNKQRLLPDESEDGIKNREYCFRLLVKEMLLDRNSGRRSPKRAEIIWELLYHSYSQDPYEYSFLASAAVNYHTSANAQLFNVFVDEAQNSGFNLSQTNFNAEIFSYYDSRRRRISPLSNTGAPESWEKPKYELLEEYCRLYLKMQYEGVQNPSVFEGIKSFFGVVNSYSLPNFSDKIKEFPNVLSKSYQNAITDLSGKYPDFNPEKLKKITNELEAKLTPEVYKMQQDLQDSRFYVALAATLGTLGIAAIIVWPWYLYQRYKQPIRATETTVQAYAKYLEKPDRADAGGQPLNQPTYEAIQERIANKEPVKEVEDKKGKILGYKTHKVVQPIEDDGTKIKVFSNRFFRQSAKFEKKIHEAEKELKQESSRRPDFH